MDVLNQVRSYLATWSKGGSGECRTLLFNAHCDASNQSNLDILTTAYHTLLSSVFSVWAPAHPLSVQAFVEFVRELLTSLPSSSSDTAAIPNVANTFGDHLVDIIWTIDAQLDEFLNDARSQIASVNEQQAQASSAALAKAKQTKSNAESDKEKVHAVVKGLIEYGLLSATSCRERLDSSVLAAVGLIQDKTMLDKKEIRTRTGIFYKQNKFNLLREQSEGYSKLVTEITSSLGPAHSQQTGLPTEPISVIDSRARPVWEKVISLIGYFDLDPNRALDLILDMFSVHLTTHHSFFLSLLSYSPWASPDRRGLARQNEDVNMDTNSHSYEGKTLDEILDMGEKARPSRHDKDGSRVLAQVLGFKLVHYQTLSTESTPKSLFLMCALLIREGYISLEDIYPHLSPLDEEMEDERKEYMSNIQARISGAKMSALAMAAPLESSNSHAHGKAKASTAPPEAKKPERKDNNQKAGLLNALLALGELRPAIAILSKFPWLVDAHPELADLLLRILSHTIDGLYSSVNGDKVPAAGFSQPRSRYGASGVIRPAARKPMLTTWAPTPPSTSTTDFVFFFPSWSDRVPVASSLAEIETIVEPLLVYLGPHLSRDPYIICKLLRLGRQHITTNETDNPSIGDTESESPVRQFWLKVIRSYMLPSLALIRGNTICTVEVWNILKTYDLSARWQLYGEWKSSMYKSHPELRVREVQADKESKDILRRLSHNTIDSLSGPVGKLAHGNPCIFFTHAVNQVMAYDNLASVVIQALKFVTIMGFDVLVFVILDAFSNPHKARVKDDGVNITDWLQSLASFTGMLFRRYSTDLTPVLSYVVHQLRNDQTSETVVLRELIWKLAGIEPLPTLSDSQISAMAGGPILRIQAIASSTRGARMDPTEVNLRGPNRLAKALLDSNLALPLLIQVAQQRQSCVFKAPDAPLKSLASLFDSTHGVLLQYLELLTDPEIMDPEDYATKVLPSLGDLGEKYGITAPICMQIVRPVLHHKLLQKALALEEQERVANEEAEKRLKAALTAKREPSTTASRVASPALGTGGDAPKPEPPAEESAMEVDTTTPPVPESPWVPELAELFEDVKKIVPASIYEVLGPGFYTTFWQLSTYDLSPPSARYHEEGATLRALSREEDAKSKRATASAGAHRLRRDRYNKYVGLLSQEFKHQTISRAFTIKRLSKEKQFWFNHAPKSAVLINAFIEHCIHPRALLSPMDADFCAQFIKVLHLQGTPGFHTLMCYDKLLGDHVKVVLFSCTEYEARNYGRFLLGVLSDLQKWFVDEQTFTQENRTKSGGKYVPLPGLQRSLSNKPVSTSTEILSWSNFQMVTRKWHRKLAKCFTDCIQTGEFMHVYNAIIVLKEIITMLPLTDLTGVPGSDINTVMDKLIATEDRGDLKILARAYSASLKKREHLWKCEKPATKSSGAATIISSTHSTSSPAPEKPRVNGSGPAQSSAPDEIRRTSSQPTLPSGPRALNHQTQQPSQSLPSQQNAETSQPTKMIVEGIPRPDVIKRVRTETKAAEGPRPAEAKADISGAPIRPIPVHISETSNSRASMYPPRPSGVGSPIPVHSSGRDSTDSRRNDERGGHRVEHLPDMPPPSIPSQTLSAQELRETARQSVHQHRMEKMEGRNASGSNAPSPRVRSSSPTTNSRPRTREPSAESHDSGGRMRSERSDRDRAERSERGNQEPGPDDRDRKESSRQENPTVSRRDSLTHTRERANRDRASGRGEGDRERDNDRGRDRHGDRERDKDRDRDRDRSDRDRDRDRERDRDRDRDRDRHRRDDKDRDRDGGNRKDRDSTARGTPTTSLDGLPNRPEPSTSRHRPSGQGADDGLGKRRRTDDDSDRASKRSSRKESHRDSERGRRQGQDKDAHDRNRGESDRRRKEREVAESESREARGAPPEKAPEKRAPLPAPVSTNVATPSGGSPQVESPSGRPQPSLPLGPRAMVDRKLADKRRDREAERDKERERDRGRGERSGAASGTGTRPPAPPPSLGSLRSRIEESQPKPPTGPSHLSRISAAQQQSQQQTPQHQPGGDESRQGSEEKDSRKRTVSDREKDVEPPNGTGEASSQPPKRPKINRTRYAGGGGGVARKLLPIDPHAADKNLRRHD